jgi:hypothetical protein
VKEDKEVKRKKEKQMKEDKIKQKGRGDWEKE